MDLQFGQYTLQSTDRRLLGPGGPIELSARSFDILVLLLARPEQIISKEELFDVVWPKMIVEENTLQVHVSALRKVLPSGMITTIHGRGYKYAGPAPQEARPLLTAETGRRPVILVVPFTNLSDDPDQQYFSDGVTTDIIDRLTRYRTFAVIDAKLTGKGLSPDYVLTGNIRKSADRIRIAVGLAEAATNTTVWAERYDRPLGDLFAVQDDVASFIARALVSRVEVKVALRSGIASPAQLSSYDLVLRGMWHFKTITPDAFNKASHCFAQAITIDPENAEAYRWLAICENSRWLFDFDWQGMERCLPLAARAVGLDPTSSGSHAVLGFCRMWLEGLDAAAESYDKAVSLNPDDPHILTEVGLLNVYKGDLAAAHAHFRLALSTDPLQPIWYTEFAAVCHFVEGQYAKAVPAFIAIPDGAWDMMYALACYGLMGEKSNAREILAKLARAGKSPDWSLGISREPFRDPQIKERISEGIRIALSF